MLYDRISGYLGISLKMVLPILILGLTVGTVLTQSAQKTRQETDTPQPPYAPEQVYRETNNTAFQAGERLKYRIHYGWFNAGTATFEVEEQLAQVNGRDCYNIYGLGKTAKWFEWFYKLRDEMRTFVDAEALIPWNYTKKSRQGSFRFNDEVTFDHFNGYVEGVKGRFEMPLHAQDMLSAMYYARSLDLRNAPVGKVFEIPIFFDDGIYNVGVKVKGREVIDTPKGRFRCLKLAPILIVGRVFKGEEDMTVWVTDDANLIPVYIESPVAVGAVEVELRDWENLRNPIEARVDD